MENVVFWVSILTERAALIYIIICLCIAWKSGDGCKNLYTARANTHTHTLIQQAENPRKSNIERRITHLTLLRCVFVFSFGFGTQLRHRCWWWTSGIDSSCLFLTFFGIVDVVVDGWINFVFLLGGFNFNASSYFHHNLCGNHFFMLVFRPTTKNCQIE